MDSVRKPVIGRPDVTFLNHAPWNRFVAVKKLRLDHHVKNEQVRNFDALSRYSSVGLVQETMV